MAKQAWEMDPDVAALGVRQKKAINWGRILLALVIVGAGTFVAAYYVPLFRAHQTLIDEFKVASEKVEQKETELRRTQSDLQQVTGEKDKLTKAQADRDMAKQTEAEAMAALKGKLEETLGGYPKKRMAEARVVDGAVEVALSARLAFAPNSVGVARGAANMLCQLAKQIDGQILVQGVGSPKEAPNFMLKAKYADAWALAAARGASVAEFLQSTCKVDAVRLTSGGRMAAGGTDASTVSMPYVALVVTPKTN